MAIDLPAGLGEVMVVSNDISKVDLIAADVLSQLEHDSAARAFVLSNIINLIR